jgi:2EXR family
LYIATGFHQLLTMSDIQSSIPVGAGPLVKTTSPTFTLFPKLAVELRLRIWELALPGPRLVEMRSDACPRDNSHRSTPSILHVCSESRAEALKWYTALPLGLASDPLRAVYVNFEIDTLYFSVDPADDWKNNWLWTEYGLGLEHSMMNNVRFLAISSKAWETQGAITFIQRFGRLEELDVIVFDVGTGEINDEHELELWDEWRIGYEVGVSIRTTETEMADSDRALVGLIEREVMTRKYGGLKNMKVRVVTVERAGPIEELPDEDVYAL